MITRSIIATTIADAWFQSVYGLVDKYSEIYCKHQHTHCIEDITKRLLRDNELGSYGIRLYKITKGSYEGQLRLSYDYITTHITQPYSYPVLPEIPAHIKIPSPTTRQYVDTYFEEYISPYSVFEKPENMQYTYAERLKESYFKIVNNFKTKGFGSNQEVMQIAMPSDIDLSDPPCLRQIDCRIRDNALHFIIYFRSWDLWGGFPSNLAALQMLKEMMADEIGVCDGEMICSSKGLHLYDHVFELAKLRMGR
jgi:thymidylate synthase